MIIASHLRLFDARSRKSNFAGNFIRDLKANGFGAKLQNRVNNDLACFRCFPRRNNDGEKISLCLFSLVSERGKSTRGKSFAVTFHAARSSHSRVEKISSWKNISSDREWMKLPCIPYRSKSSCRDHRRDLSSAHYRKPESVLAESPNNQYPSTMKHAPRY